jgi:hypothetical protein
MMPISQAIFEIVPVGEENAVSGRLLWKQLGMWSAQGVKHKLNQLAAEGPDRTQADRERDARDEFVFQIANLKGSLRA